VYVCMFVCMCVCMCVGVHVYVHTYMCTYPHTYRLLLFHPHYCSMCAGHFTIEIPLKGHRRLFQDCNNFPFCCCNKFFIDFYNNYMNRLGWSFRRWSSEISYIVMFKNSSSTLVTRFLPLDSTASIHSLISHYTITQQIAGSRFSQHTLCVAEMCATQHWVHTALLHCSPFLRHYIWKQRRYLGTFVNRNVFTTYGVKNTAAKVNQPIKLQLLFSVTLMYLPAYHIANVWPITYMDIYVC